MRKYRMLLLLLVLLGMLTACRSVSLGVEHSGITSATVYYTNEGLKKDVTEQADIAKLLSQINSLKIVGDAGETGTGGQCFVCVFHQTDRTQKVCTLLDGGGSFRYADSGMCVATSAFDALALWEGLDYEPQRAVAEEEVADIPSV